MFSKLKDWLIVHCAETVKCSTSILMLFTASLICYDHYANHKIIPDYFMFTERDFIVWVWLLTVTAVVQLIMLWHVDCYRCRLVADLILQFSGFLLLIIGWAFIAEYPPLSSLMFLYPTWGLSVIIAGRHMSKRGRSRYRKFQEGSL